MPINSDAARGWFELLLKRSAGALVLASLALVLGGWRESKHQPNPRIEIFTFNIKLEGCPGQLQDCERRQHLPTWREEMRLIAETIREADADVVALQEVSGSAFVKHGTSSTPSRKTHLDHLAFLLRDVYPYVVFGYEPAGGGTPKVYGNATLSRFPMRYDGDICLFRGSGRLRWNPSTGQPENTGKPKPGYGNVYEAGCQRPGDTYGSGNRGAVAVEIDLPSGETIAFLNTHFGVYWNSSSYNLWDANAGCSGLVLNQHLSESSMPMILAGDFNVLCRSADMNKQSEARGLGINNNRNLSVRWDYFHDGPEDCLYNSGEKSEQIDYVLGSRSGRDWSPDWALVDRYVIYDFKFPREEDSSQDHFFVYGEEGLTSVRDFSTDLHDSSDFSIGTDSTASGPPVLFGASDHYGLMTVLELLRPAPQRAPLDLDSMIDQCSDHEVWVLADECLYQNPPTHINPDGTACVRQGEAPGEMWWPPPPPE